MRSPVGQSQISIFTGLIIPLYFPMAMTLAGPFGPQQKLGLIHALVENGVLVNSSHNDYAIMGSPLNQALLGPRSDAIENLEKQGL